MKSQAVIGLGFGDEGKGITTSYLCLQNQKSLVVRYSGGQQAGHTVVLDGKRHVFSNFGSGTLNGHPTYWSKYCTFDPIGFYNELQIIRKLRIEPYLYIDGKSPVTTPMDKIINQNNDFRNGTCGVGVGTTLLREEKFFHLLFEDLFHPFVLKTKIELMRQYYSDCNQERIDVFYHCIDYIVKLFKSNGRYQKIYKLNDIFSYNIENVIFESSQGLLLDQHYGFFPHVTRSNVGTPNILEMGHNPEIWCVTRAYQTRHGNGPMTNTEIPHTLKLNPLETNVNNNFQGEFRVSLLDLDLLKYGIEKDAFIKVNRHNLMITCIDQLEDKPRFTYEGKILEFDNVFDFMKEVKEILDFDYFYYSDSDDSRNIKQLNF